MSENDAGMIYAKLLVLETIIKNLSSNFDEYKVQHHEEAEKRNKSITELGKLFISKTDQIVKNCYEHAQVEALFKEHIKKEEQVKFYFKDKAFVGMMTIAVGMVSSTITIIIQNWLGGKHGP
jgi:hypothetical protein